MNLRTRDDTGSREGKWCPSGVTSWSRGGYRNSDANGITKTLCESNSLFDTIR